jgi:glycosyltransferase involved in cell wall biosynthesis
MRLPDAKTRPKLLQLIPNLGRGGAQKVFHEHRRFLAADYDVVCCVFNFDGAFDREKDSGIISLDVPGGTNIVSKTFFFLKRVWKLRKIKRSLGIAITVSHLEGADYINVLSRRNDKVMLWIHGSKKYDLEIKGSLGWLRLNLMLPFLYRRADRIVCVSEGIREELLLLVDDMKNKISVVRNGIDIEDIRKKVNSPGDQWDQLFRNNFVIITHCRFAQQKNLGSLLKVIAKLKGKTGVKWVIAGDGEQRQALLDRCREMGLPHHQPWQQQEWSANELVYFIGHQENPFPFLAASQLYVLTSLWEGFPLSVCEAIACGLPVISADCPTGPREILAPGLHSTVTAPTNASYGVLMPLLSNEERIGVWADYILKLIDNRDLLNSYRAKSSVSVSRFSIGQSASKTIEEIMVLTK